MTSKGLAGIFTKWTLLIIVVFGCTDTLASIQSELVNGTVKYAYSQRSKVSNASRKASPQSSISAIQSGFSIKPINCLTTYPDQACQMNITVTLPEDLVATPVCLYQNGQRLKCWVPVDRFVFDANVKINNRDVFELKDLELMNFYRQEVKVSATQNKRRRLRPRWSIF